MYKRQSASILYKAYELFVPKSLVCIMLILLTVVYKALKRNSQPVGSYDGRRCCGGMPRYSNPHKFKTTGNGVPFMLSSGIAKTISDFMTEV